MSAEATDVWTIVNRQTGEHLHTVRLFQNVPMDTLEGIADYAGPGLSKAVMWNPRTGEVVF